MSKQQQHSDLERRQKKIERAYIECFSTASGKIVLEHLESLYSQRVFNSDALTMARNAACFDLVMDMKNIVNRGLNNND